MLPGPLFQNSILAKKKQKKKTGCHFSRWPPVEVILHQFCVKMRDWDIKLSSFEDLTIKTHILSSNYQNTYFQVQGIMFLSYNIRIIKILSIILCMETCCSQFKCDIWSMDSMVVVSTVRLLEFCEPEQSWCEWTWERLSDTETLRGITSQK